MLYERRQFRYGAIEATQLVLGLSIPALIIAHIADARLAYDLFGNEKYYSQLFAFYTTSRPYMMPVQYLVLIVSWTHGCIGLYFWFRLRPWFRRSHRCCSRSRCCCRPPPRSASIRAPRRCGSSISRREWRAETLSVQACRHAASIAPRSTGSRKDS